MSKLRSSAAKHFVGSVALMLAIALITTLGLIPMAVAFIAIILVAVYQHWVIKRAAKITFTAGTPTLNITAKAQKRRWWGGWQDIENR